MIHLGLTGCQRKVSLGEVSGTIFSSADFKRVLAWVSIAFYMLAWCSFFIQ